MLKMVAKVEFRSFDKTKFKKKILVFSKFNSVLFIYINVSQGLLKTGWPSFTQTQNEKKLKNSFFKIIICHQILNRKVFCSYFYCLT